MSDLSIRRTSPERVYPDLVDPGSRVPRPDEIFLNPLGMVRALKAIAPRIRETGAWWAVGGRAGENLLDVHVNPTRIVILCEASRLEEIRRAVADLSPSDAKESVEQLKRRADLGGMFHPVFTKATTSSFTVEGVDTFLLGDFRFKVGDWEWGDPFVFDPVEVNVAGVQVSVMPLRLRSEVYITLGWSDRAKLVSDATLRAHHFLKDIGVHPY